MSIVAVASSDGVTINEHFGQAKQFIVYKVDDDGSYRELERREILPYVGGGASSANSHEGTVAQLEGIDAVLALQIGPGAAESLQARDIKGFGVKGLIERALTSYGKRHRLLDQAIPAVSGHRCGSGGGCGGGSGRGGCR